MPPDDPTTAPSPPSPSVTALVVKPPRQALADDVRTQRLWLSLQQRAWRSMAVVSASPGIETMTVANNLAKIAWWYTGQPSVVFDMRDLSLRLLDHQLREMVSHVHRADRVFVALRATSENPTAAPIARATDAAVLCVELGTSHEKHAQQTLDAIGRERFVGAILTPRSDGASTEVWPPSQTYPPGHQE